MIGTLRNVGFDAPDHGALVRFYARLLGGDILGESPEWSVMGTPDGWRIGCQPAADFRPPTWPSQELPQQLHLDLQVPDLGAAADRAQALGAASTGGGDGQRLLVMTDPAGHPFCLCANEQAEPIRIFGVCIDCPDPAALARFYAVLLGLESRYEGADGAWLASENGMVNVTFQVVADYSPPRWPDPAYPQQAHLCVMVDDIDAAQAQVMAIGGQPLPGGGDNWRVHADPVGHPFCLVFNPA